MTLASLADAPSHDTMIQPQRDDHHSTTSPLPRDTLLCPVQTPLPSITRDLYLREHTFLPPSYFLPPADIHFETTAAPTTFLPFATYALSIELHLTNIRSFTQTSHCHCHCRHQIEQPTFLQSTRTSLGRRHRPSLQPLQLSALRIFE
jgi:hypothetical protein